MFLCLCVLGMPLPSEASRGYHVPHSLELALQVGYETPDMGAATALS